MSPHSGRLEPKGLKAIFRRLKAIGTATELCSFGCIENAAHAGIASFPKNPASDL